GRSGSAWTYSGRTPAMQTSDGLAGPASPNTATLLVFAHCRVDFFPPGIKATFEIQQILKTLPAKKLDYARAADAALAHHDRCLCPRNLRQALRNCSERDQLRIRNTRNLKFEWLAHVNERDFLAARYHFVELPGGNPGNLRTISPVAKLLVVDRLRDCRRIAANRTVWIAANLKFAKPQAQRIHMQEAPKKI